MSEHSGRRRIRIVVCRGQYCNLGRRGDAILKRVEALVEPLNGDAYPKPIKVETANCLSMCGAGPNVVIYPDGVVCNGVTVEAVDALIAPYVEV